MHDVPNLVVATQVPSREDILLQVDELKRAEELVINCSKLSEPLAPEVKVDVEALKVRLAHYKELSDRLDQVQTALVNNKSEIKDQLIEYTDVETPIFFAKIYQDEHKEWNNVPGLGYVTDKETISNWLKINPTHTLNRDVIKDPSPYKGMPTRYTMHELTSEHCYSNELGESADEIRALLNKLPAQLEAAKQQKVSLGSSSHSIYNQNAARSDAAETLDESSRNTL